MILTPPFMKTIPEAILAYAHRSAEGQVLSPKDFLHMGNRTAVDQALSRLSREGHLIRVDRGAYVAPVRCRAGCRPPGIEKVVKSLAALSGELIALDGAASAMSFGLAERQQIAPRYFTSGRSRTLLLGEVEVVLQHAPVWMLALGNSPAGMAVRAMVWLGPDALDESLAKIRRSLSSSAWLALVACRAALPSWIARAISESVAQGVPGQQSRRGRLAIEEGTSDALNLGAGAEAEVVSNQTMGAA
jgi:hypothetical protein